MNFKEALIAHLQGEKVEARASQMDVHWQDFIEYHRGVQLYLIADTDFASACEYRLKPRTITVNGREILAGESVALKTGVNYFIANPAAEDMCGFQTWMGDEMDHQWLQRGLVHLTKENAIAHAKAMLGID